jgi:transitional endoplasmic reticulum ATPase
MLDWPQRREIRQKVEEGLSKCGVVLLYGHARSGKSRLAEEILAERGAYVTISPLEFERMGIVGAADDAFDLAIQNASNFWVDDIDMFLSPSLIWRLCDLVDRARNGTRFCSIIGVTSRAHAVHPQLMRANRFDYLIEMGSLIFNDTQEIVERLFAHSDSVELKTELAKRMSPCTIVDALKISSLIQEQISQNSDLPEHNSCEVILAKLELELNNLRSQQLGSTLTRLKSFEDVELEDLIGLNSEIEFLDQCLLSPLRNKKTYANLGVNLPKGVLLYGTPGNGKTSLAIAISGKARKEGLVTAVLMLDASQIVSKVVGKSEYHLREVFQECRKLSPCILIIDQIEVLAASRSFSNSNSMDRTLSTLLIELDGLSESSYDSGLILVCTTRSPNLLDPAILRPGRLDLHIEIPELTFASRKDLFSHFCGPNSKESTLEHLAHQSGGYSAAQVRLLYRMASMEALRDVLSDDAVILETHWKKALKSMESLHESGHRFMK